MSTEQGAASDADVVALVPDVRRLARSVSYKTGGAVDADELFSIGECALVAAAVRWEPSRYPELRCYAMPRVRGAMLDYLRLIDPMSRRSRTRLKQLEADPAAASSPSAARILESKLSIVSLNTFDNPDEACFSMTDAGGAPDSHKYNPELLVPAIQRLSPVEQFVIWQTCVSGVVDKRVGAFIGGLTGSRVQQLRKAALQRLRQFFTALNKEPCQ